MAEDQTTEAPGAEELPPLAASVVEDSQGESKNLLDSFRKRREENVSRRDTYIPLPGYDREPPILMAHYRLIDGPELDRIARKVRKEVKDQWQRQTLAAVDMIISACDGMFYDLQDGKGPQPMTLNGQPILGYDQDLAQALDFKAETARQVVFGVFADNDIAIMQHNARLSLWMSDTSRDVDQDFLGEM